MGLEVTLKTCYFSTLCISILISSMFHSMKMTKMTQAKLEDMLHLVMANAENKTGHLDYNKYGVKDGLGFISCSDQQFVDNFVLCCYVPEYLVKDKQYVDVGSTNKTIRRCLTEEGLEGAVIKAISLRKLSAHESKHVDPDIVMNRNKQMEDSRKKPTYYRQEYKIACPDHDYTLVMAVLRGAAYRKYNIFLRDVDVTLDYSGSFKRQEVLEILLRDDKFRLQGSEKPADCVILCNEKDVGLNCLSWMETVQGMSIRSKLYNKFVQMLETQAVRSRIGNHWMAWVDQALTTLAANRDDARERGLTRCEVTFYCEDKIPTDDFIINKLLAIAESVPKEAVYATPYHDTWRAYCETFHHSLVVVDKISEKGRGIIVYSVNEVTGKVSGKLFKYWSEREKWCLANLTLSQKLPIDIIEIHPPGKHTDEKEKYRVTKNTYAKENSRGIPFKTRLVCKGPYTASWQAKKDMCCELLLKDAGMISHENCLPYLSPNKAGRHSKSNLLLHHVEEGEPLGIPLKQRRNKRQHKTTADMDEEVLESKGTLSFGEVVKAVATRQACKRKSIPIFRAYARTKHGNLCQLEKGTYNIVAMKPCKQKYGERFVLLLEVNDGLLPCYSNFDIEEYMSQVLPRQKRLELLRQNVLYLDEDEPLATLTITGRKRDKRSRLVACASFKLSKALLDIADVKQNEKTQPPQPDEEEKAVKPVIPVIPPERMLPYRDLPNLCHLPKGSTHRVAGIAYTEYYGSKLVVMLDDEKLYQAGDNLTEQRDKLIEGCEITIVKYRIHRSSRKKFAICEVVGGLYDACLSSTSRNTSKRKMETADDMENVDEKRIKL